MKTSEIREMNPEERLQKLTDLKEELFNLRFQLATNQLDNTARLRGVRRDIARIKTLMHEKAVGSAQ